MKHALRFWSPVAAYMGLIFYLSSRESFPFEPPLWLLFADKIAHVVAYSVLGFLFLRAWLAGRWVDISLKACAAAVACTTLYGITDEYHQSFVPGRTPSAGDVASDFAGGALACAAVWIYVHWRNASAARGGIRESEA